MSTVYVVIMEWYEGMDVSDAYSNKEAAEAHREALAATIRPAGMGTGVGIWPLEVKDAFTGLEDGDQGQAVVPVPGLAITPEPYPPYRIGTPEADAWLSGYRRGRGG